MREEINRAERLKDAGKGRRANTVEFSLTVLQHRLASSPEAILRSIERRRRRLEKRRQEVLAARSRADARLEHRLAALLGRSHGCGPLFGGPAEQRAPLDQFPAASTASPTSRSGSSRAPLPRKRTCTVPQVKYMMAARSASSATSLPAAHRRRPGTRRRRRSSPRPSRVCALAGRPAVRSAAAAR